MRPKPSMPKSIAVLAHPDIPDALNVAENVGAFLLDRGIKVQIGSLQDEDLRSGVRVKEFELLIALGGDGTMLRAGHLCAPVDVPLLGINIGHFGFLAEFNPGGLERNPSKPVRG